MSKLVTISHPAWKPKEREVPFEQAFNLWNLEKTNNSGIKFKDADVKAFEDHAKPTDESTASNAAGSNTNTGKDKGK